MSSNFQVNMRRGTTATVLLLLAGVLMVACSTQARGDAVMGVSREALGADAVAGGAHSVLLLSDGGLRRSRWCSGISGRFNPRHTQRHWRQRRPPRTTTHNALDPHQTRWLQYSPRRDRRGGARPAQTATQSAGFQCSHVYPRGGLLIRCGPQRVGTASVGVSAEALATGDATITYHSTFLQMLLP